MSPLFQGTDFFAAAFKTSSLLHKVCIVSVHDFNGSHRPAETSSLGLYQNGENPTSCPKTLCVKGTVKPKGTQTTVAYYSSCRVKRLGLLSNLHGRILVPFLSPYCVCASANMSKSCCFNENDRSYGRHTNISLIVRAQLFKRGTTPATV